jgi:RNA polymerase sigma-70 factor (ECF subfamily)
MISLNPALVEIAPPEPRDLLAQALAGDAEAFGELCRAYENPLVRQAMTLCADAAVAEELAQDTLVEAWRCLRRYNGRCQFFTWLCAILLNRYRNTVRQKRSLLFAALAPHGRREAANAFEELPADGSLPDEAAQRQDEAVLLQQCVAALPAKHQQVIHLRFYVDDSLEGIAAALGCSVGTVKSRLFYALDKLRAMNALREQRASGTQMPTVRVVASERGHSCPPRPEAGIGGQECPRSDAPCPARPERLRQMIEVL